MWVKNLILALYKKITEMSRKNIGRQGFNKKIINRFSNIKGPISNFNITEKNIDEREEKINEMPIYYNLHSEYEDYSDKHNITVGFLIVATGKYDVFVDPLIRSIEKYVLPNNKKHYNIFSDKPFSIEGVSYSVFPVEHKPFPYPTLKRFHFFNTYKNSIAGDQIVYIDADTLIKKEIGTEILYPITVTQHCGFVNMPGSFEKRQLSKAYVNPREYKNYVGGGFYSFSRTEFFKMSEYCMNIINMDESMGIIPVWHDESAINKYISTVVTPTRVLSPSYHYPESNKKIYDSWGGQESFECKILLLDKNHKEIRS